MSTGRILIIEPEALLVEELLAPLHQPGCGPVVVSTLRAGVAALGQRRRLRLCAWRAEHPLNLIQVMLAKGREFVSPAVGAWIPRHARMQTL